MERRNVEASSDLAGTCRFALSLAMRALARRGLSEAAVRSRLRGAGIPAPAEDEAVETLIRLGYVDDARLAHERAASMADRGYGNPVIEERLLREGVGKEAARRALASLEPEDERARRLALEPPRRSVPQLARFLSRRGFDSETIETVLVRTADVEA